MVEELFSLMVTRSHSSLFQLSVTIPMPVSPDTVPRLKVPVVHRGPSSRLNSQPVLSLPSQFWNRALQSGVHAPETHEVVPLGFVHALPQVPQLPASVARLKPSSIDPLQLSSTLLQSSLSTSLGSLHRRSPPAHPVKTPSLHKSASVPSQGVPRRESAEPSAVEGLQSSSTPLQTSGS